MRARMGMRGRGKTEPFIQNIHPLETRRDFVARGLRAREEAWARSVYVEAREMLIRLDASLARARGHRHGKERSTPEHTPDR